ncbi:hypothetical protein H0H81_005212 [Sphagnurus paluster]|uniref:Uncharacterized protein n=1 Tax=Sphagnurus paluster TaxID=117069 RepID=A0A9P7GKP0_9AGAR|nr:hypothetical protein H0H81_005212 [Sphagnurus paluster]
MSITSYDPRFLQDIPDTLSPEDRQKLALAVTLDFTQRVELYEGLIERCSGSQQALALVRLAELQAGFGSGSVAVGLYRKAQKILAAERILSASFDQFIDEWEARLHDQAKKILEKSKQISFFQPWKPTNQHKFPLVLPQVPPESGQLRARWQASTLESSHLVPAYLRKLAIETNHIESVFLLTETSTQDIIRRGVDEAIVDYLPESELQDPKKIKSILNDTLAACDLIRTIVDREDTLSPEIIRRIHHRLMKTCQYTNATFTPAGRTRGETLKTVIVAGTYSIECCPYPEVDKELEYICKMANASRDYSS